MGDAVDGRRGFFGSSSSPSESPLRRFRRLKSFATAEGLPEHSTPLNEARTSELLDEVRSRFARESASCEDAIGKTMYFSGEPRLKTKGWRKISDEPSNSHHGWLMHVDAPPTITPWVTIHMTQELHWSLKQNNVNGWFCNQMASPRLHLQKKLKIQFCRSKLGRESPANQYQKGGEGLGRKLLNQLLR